MSMVRYDAPLPYAVWWQPVAKSLPIRFGHIVGFDTETMTLAVKAIDGTYNIPAEELHVVGDKR